MVLPPLLREAAPLLLEGVQGRNCGTGGLRLFGGSEEGDPVLAACSGLRRQIEGNGGLSDAFAFRPGVAPIADV